MIDRVGARGRAHESPAAHRWRSIAASDSCSRVRTRPTWPRRSSARATRRREMPVTPPSGHLVVRCGDADRPSQPTAGWRRGRVGVACRRCGVGPDGGRRGRGAAVRRPDPTRRRSEVIGVSGKRARRGGRCGDDPPSRGRVPPPGPGRGVARRGREPAQASGRVCHRALPSSPPRAGRGYPRSPSPARSRRPRACLATHRARRPPASDVAVRSHGRPEERSDLRAPQHDERPAGSRRVVGEHGGVGPSGPTRAR